MTVQLKFRPAGGELLNSAKIPAEDKREGIQLGVRKLGQES